MVRANDLIRVRHAAVRGALSASPKLARKHLERTTRRASSTYEPELRLIAAALAHAEVFIDVGANLGAYSMQSVLSGANVIAFEPNPALALRLQQTLPEAEVVAAAVSAKAGLAKLSIPRHGLTAFHSRASIVEGLHGDHPVSTLTAPVVSLDDSLPNSTYVLKIDVEGNESSVLAGAESSIRNGAVAALVESEERHMSGAPVKTMEWFAAAGFDGWIVNQGSTLDPCDRYSLATHQSLQDQELLNHGDSPSERYANNFLFIKRNSSIELNELAASAGFSVSH